MLLGGHISIVGHPAETIIAVSAPSGVIIQQGPDRRLRIDLRTDSEVENKSQRGLDLP